MNLLKISEYKNFRSAVESSGKELVERITYFWEDDLWLRRKWSYTEENSKELYMKEICFMINDEQIELLNPIMEEEPKCKVTFGQGNLQTLSLVLKFQLTDMKVTGTMRSYSPSKPCKTLPYELFLKDVEFEIMAGLIIRGDSFWIENYSNEYLNFNVTISCKSKDESKDIFQLDKIQDSPLRKSIEKYIVEKLTKDIIIAVEDRVGEVCVATSVHRMLDNEYSYRNKLRLHKKTIESAFQRLIAEICTLVNEKLESQKLSELKLPDLQGKLMEKDSGRGTFKATDGSLKSLASLQQLGDITLQQDGDDIILYVFLYFSYLDIVYKHLSIKKKDSEHIRSFETPENSNSSCLKIKFKKMDDGRIDITLLDYKVNDLGYIEINWELPENDSFKKSIEPELAMWLNYTLEYIAPSIIEERIKNCLTEVLKNDKLIPLILHAEVEDTCDSDPMDEESDEESEDEQKSEEHEAEGNGD